MQTLTIVATTLAIVPLLLIIGYVLYRGGASLTPGFFTTDYLPPALGGGIEFTDPTVPAPIGEQPFNPDDPFAGVGIDSLPGTGLENETIPGTAADGASDPAAQPRPPEGDLTQITAQGGVRHGIVGTLLVTIFALLLAIPLGLLAGIFLAEYRDNSVATVVRFCCDVLSGAPSIIVGVVAFVLIVAPTQTYSGWAGSVALAVLMVPTITRATEEMLKLVPDSTREGAMALGAPTWWSTFTVVVPTALVGIVTGVLLAFARGAGETAPLLLTIQGSNKLSFDMNEPIAALPLMIYKYIESPFPSENDLAWGAAFVLTVLVLIVNILARALTRRRTR
jgi:phosphate transport system permease protein